MLVCKYVQVGLWTLMRQHQGGDVVWVLESCNVACFPHRWSEWDWTGWNSVGKISSNLISFLKNDRAIISVCDLIFILYWNIADIHCCASFSSTAKWLSYAYTYVYISILFQILFPYSWLHNIEWSFLCHTVGPCFFKLSFLYWSIVD